MRSGYRELPIWDMDKGKEMLRRHTGDEDVNLRCTMPCPLTYQLQPALLRPVLPTIANLYPEGPDQSPQIFQDVALTGDSETSRAALLSHLIILAGGAGGAGGRKQDGAFSRGF